MKNNLLFLAVALFGLCPLEKSFAQDTTEVRSFSYSSLTRDTTIDFPAPGTSYEKILMRYNMRCHDGTVSSSGNNNGPHQGGCGEWDYSCNMYLTDPSRVDSLLSYTPSHYIGGFNGTSFPYTTVPVYQYLQTTQKEVNIGSSNLTDYTVVNNSQTATNLLETHKHAGRFFSLYTASELSNAGLTAGNFHQLTLESAGTARAGFLRVRLKQVSQTDITPSNLDVTGFTEVFYHDVNFVNGANALSFYQPFTWDGTSAILVEFSFTNSTVDVPLALMGESVAQNLTVRTSNDDFLYVQGETLKMDTTGMHTISDQITIALWTYGDPNKLPANTFLFEAYNAQNQRELNAHLPWGNGNVFWDCGNDGTGYDRIMNPAQPGEYKGNWNHWVFTKNANTGSMKIYLNGTLWYSETGKTKTIHIDQFYFGHRIEGSGNWFGSLDEISIWNVELSASEIAGWMNKSIDNTHPSYANLVAYYPLDEQGGTVVTSSAQATASSNFDTEPYWTYDRGNRLTRFFENVSFRPNLKLAQGTVAQTVTDITVMDSTLTPKVSIVEYAVLPHYGTSIDDEILVDNVTFGYNAGSLPILDENGNVVGQQSIPATDTVEIGELNYFNRYPARFELMSFVTPYGNGLNLGQEGRTYWFDVTDFGPVLQNNKRLTIERGGQWQEELDIRFYFVEGTPPRETKNIQPIWRDSYNAFAGINSGRLLEDRTISLDPTASSYAIRSTITGHGQEGEFIPRNHHLNLNGGSTEFSWEVWKACGANPIFPQGGTWVYDRAGWCPGAPTDVHYANLDPFVNPGDQLTVDYYLDNASGDSRYIVNHFLISYGSPNFTNDAKVVEIIRPSNRDEYLRLNSVCMLPEVVIQNTGSDTLTELDITYFVTGGTTQTFHWSGALDFMETEKVILPIDDYAFWTTSSTNPEFTVTVSNPNGVADEYAQNNSLKTAYTPADEYQGDLNFRFKTNNNPNENKLYLYNSAGNIVYQRTDLTANTTYNDKLQLSPGCYRLLFTDAGNDGLSFWANSGQGSGYFQFKEENSVKQNFKTDFGSMFVYDFYSAGSVGLEENEEARYVVLYPNPAENFINIQMNGETGSKVEVAIFNTLGQLVQTNKYTLSGQMEMQTLSTEDLTNGMYQVRITNNGHVSTQSLVIQH